MRRKFLDTAALILAVGGQHPLREACRTYLEEAAARRVSLHVSAEAMQELLYHRMRRSERSDALAVVRDVRAVCHVHSFDDRVVDRMISLVEATPIRGRDAVHAATAIEAGFTEIVSPDPDFDDVPGLSRRSPAD